MNSKPSLSTEQDIIRNIPSPCDDSVPATASTAKYTRADCIEYEYTRRCQGKKFLGGKVSTNLGLAFPGFAFAMLNNYCVSDAGVGSSECNDWINYVQMCANAPDSDSSRTQSDRKTYMGDDYNDKNEDIGGRRYWLWSPSPSAFPNSGGSVHPSLDFTVGGRVPGNSTSNYVSGANQNIFYPVEYDAKMRNSVCDKPDMATSADAAKDPDELFGWADALSPEDAITKSYTAAAYTSIQIAGSISSSGTLTLNTAFPFKLKPKVRVDDSIEIIPATMIFDPELPLLSADPKQANDETIVPVSLDTTGQVLTVSLSEEIVDGLKKGKYYILVRHGGSGCRCIETPPRINLGTAASTSIKKECLFSYCDTKRVQELKSNPDGSIQYPRQDYLSAVDGSMVTDFSFYEGNCPSSITVCSVDIRAKRMIVKNTQIDQKCSSKITPSANNKPIHDSSSGGGGGGGGSAGGDANADGPGADNPNNENRDKMIHNILISVAAIVVVCCAGGVWYFYRSRSGQTEPLHPASIEMQPLPSEP